MASRFVLPFADVGSGISPSDGAKLEFFASGTSTQKDTFTDEALTTPNANPVIANGDGVFDDTDIFLPDGGRYKVTLKDKNNVLIFESDPVVGGVSGSLSIKSFDTVAAMVASTELNIGDIVETAGYLSKGDSGDNQYEVVAAATGTVDAGNFIDLATHQAKGLFPRGTSTLKQWGAVGDGVADDRNAIQAVIDSAPISCYFPSGKYLVNSQLNILATTRSLRCFGDAPATLTNDLNQTAELILGFDGIMFDVVGTTNHLGIEFTNIRFDGDATNNLTSGTCFKFTGGPRRILLDHCYIEDFRTFGLDCVSVGGMVINECQIFNNGINLNGDGLADSFVYGGQTGSGAGGGAPWVSDNISIQGSSGNTHFIAHRPNFSAGIGVKIGGNATRISFVGGICDQNLLGGFSLEDQCTAITISGMDIFENGTTTVNKPGILINTSQDAAGFLSDAGISIIGNSIFDRAKGAAGEKQDVAIEFDTGGSVNNTAVIGNGLLGSTTPIKDPTNILVKTGVIIQNNIGYVTEIHGITANVNVGSTGVKSIAVDTSALSEDLHSGTVVLTNITFPTNTDFAGTVFTVGDTSGTTFDIRINVTTASVSGSATIKFGFQVLNAN